MFSAEVSSLKKQSPCLWTKANSSILLGAVVPPQEFTLWYVNLCDEKNCPGHWTVTPTGHKNGGDIQGIRTASPARAETLSDALGTKLRRNMVNKLFDLQILFLPYFFYIKFLGKFCDFFPTEYEDSSDLERKESCQCVYIMRKTI